MSPPVSDQDSAFAATTRVVELGFSQLLPGDFVAEVWDGYAWSGLDHLGLVVAVGPGRVVTLGRRFGVEVGRVSEVRVGWRGRVVRSG